MLADLSTGLWFTSVSFCAVHLRSWLVWTHGTPLSHVHFMAWPHCTPVVWFSCCPLELWKIWLSRVRNSMRPGASRSKRPEDLLQHIRSMMIASSILTGISICALTVVLPVHASTLSSWFWFFAGCESVDVSGKLWRLTGSSLDEAKGTWPFNVQKIWS